ncbi:MAG TPA: NAD(P)/FAD-dependent oxidoreductase [Rhizobacter sp.]|nr:NAD(P)/FAD-dependent oxidoreductase [Rhizobacter sp.]
MDPGHGLIETDAVVIGAGPVGLFQVFELGLLEIKAHVIDSLGVAGGQCVELYAGKPIYDIPGVPMCTAQQLIDNLQKQIQPFGATFHLGQQVNALARQDDGRFAIETSLGTRFLAHNVFIAGGSGSFQARRLRIDGLDAFEQTQVFYRIDEPARFSGKHVVVAGGTDLALDAAVALAQAGPHRAARVTLVHRRDVFQADPTLIAQVQELRDAAAIDFVAGQLTGIESGPDGLNAVQVSAGDGSTRSLPLDALLVMLGFNPKLGPIADWGLNLERKQILVDTERFETSTPGIFAVGDVNTYPGKKKLILCGFHEATLAAFGAAARLRPDHPAQLLYTTTSSKLHQLLGVTTPDAN